MTINSSAQSILIVSNNKTSSSSEKSSTAQRNNKSSEEKIYADPQIEKDRRIQMKNEYYAKKVEEDKKFENPRGHIYNKYNNKYSPYYIEGLTDAERFAAGWNELNYLKSGENGSLLLNDPLFRGMEPINGLVEEAQKKAFLRQEANNQFGQLLKDNNITIPQDTKLRFTIDPYSYKLNVSGTEDSSLSKSIEDVFNSAENSKQLYYHIMATDLYDNTQFSTEKSNKRSLFYEIKDKTGYDLRDLSVVDGKFLTEDGTDVFEIYKKSIEDGTSVPDRYKGVAIGYYGELLSNLAKKGFDAVPDLILSIDYEKGSFYDVGQSKNFGKGQTDWIEELRASSIQKTNQKFTELLDTNNITIPHGKIDYKGYMNKIIREAFENILQVNDKLNQRIESGILDKDEIIRKFLLLLNEDSGMDQLTFILEKLANNELSNIDYKNGSFYDAGQSKNIETVKMGQVDTYA